MKTNKEISAGIIIYRHTKEGPKFLLLYHGREYWNFPKGHIETGERGIETAFREVNEETGLSARDLVLKKHFKATNHWVAFREKERVFRIAIFYLAESKRAEIKVSEEHDGYGWFLHKDAIKLLKYPDLKDILKKANDLLKKGKKS